jgi:hypothetical protein
LRSIRIYIYEIFPKLKIWQSREFKKSKETDVSNSLKSKMIIPIVGLLILMTGFIFVFVSMSVRSLADYLTYGRITMASNATQAQLDNLEDQTRVVARSVAGSYVVVSNLLNWNANPLDRADARQQLVQYLQAVAIDMGVDSFVVRDALGVIVLRLHDLTLYGDADGSAAGIASLRGETTTSYSSTPTMPMGLNTTVPIWHSGQIIGTMTPLIFLYTDEFVQHFASLFNAEVTIFGGNRSVASTMLDNSGNRVLGLEADDNVVEEVLRQGHPFTTAMSMFDIPYYVHYLPLHNLAGNPVNAGG